MDEGEEPVGFVLDGVAADDCDQRSAALDFDGGGVGVLKGLGEGLWAAGVEVGGDELFLGGGDLWGGVVDESESGRSGAHGVGCGDGLGCAVKTDQGWRQDAAGASVAGWPERVVSGLGVEVDLIARLALGQVAEDGRCEGVGSRGGGLGQIGGQFAEVGGSHGGDVGEGGVHDEAALPEEDAVVIGGGAASDLLAGPSGLAVEGVGTVGTAGVREAEGAEGEGFAAAGVVGELGACEAIFGEGGGICGVGLGGSVCRPRRG